MNDAMSALLVVICIDLMLFFGQQAIVDINPDAPQFWGEQGDILLNDDINKGNYTMETDMSALDPLEQDEDVEQGDTTIWDDLNIFLLMKNWIKSTKGYQYAASMIAAPYYFLVAVHAPQAVCYALGAAWSILTIVLIILLIAGRL